MNDRAYRMLSAVWIPLAALALVLSGCGATTEETDGGNGDQDAGIDECAVDNSQRRGTDPAWKLEAGGEPIDGFICPKNDVDHFWFEVPSPQTIVEVTLKNNVSMSPVDYCYDIYFQGEDAKVSGKCDYDGLDGVTEVIGTHYLQSAGTYFLEVRDASSDDQDARNGYMLSIDTVQDPDGYEPNNTPDDAKVPGAAKGYLSYLGDEDWYKIEGAQAGQLVIIDLATEAAAAPDLRYTLYMPDKTTPVNAGDDFNGMDGPTALHDVLPLAQNGTYYLQVVDLDGDDSDLEVGYTLQVSKRNDPDSRDETDTPNNGWDRATGITSGQVISNAYLATRGDEDWYKIVEPGITDTAPAVIEVELEMNSSSPVDPAIDLIVADPRTDCVPGDACEELVWTCGGCNNDKECQDAQCPSHECFAAVGKCRGAGMCLPRVSGNGCGIRSLVMHGADWSPSGNPRHLRTAAPMYGDTYYILVRDYQADQVDLENAYTLTVTVHPEPDPYEPNGLYLPYITGDQEDTTRDWNKSLAKEVSCTLDAAGLTCGPIEGWLSYRGDQDWYKLLVTGQSYTIPSEPEPEPEADSTVIDWDIQFEWDFHGNNAMNIGYVIAFGQRMGFEAGVGSGTWGDGANECSYFCGESPNMLPATVYLWVREHTFRQYDYTNPYTITLKGYRGCPLNCYYCDPDNTDDYPCPNPDNPDPW